jgi:predicted nucleotidyltransferase
VSIERDVGAAVDAVAMKQDNRPMQTSLASQLPSIAKLCERYGVAQLELFGSAAGPDFKPEGSDFDFLVELDRQAPGSRARRWIELAEALEKLLGRPVDLVNPHYIRNPYFLQAVNQSRTLVYDQQSAQAAV